MSACSRSRLAPGLLAAALLALAAPARGQSGFVPGDLYLYTNALTGISSGDGGIARIDPLTGAMSVFHDLASSVQFNGAMCWDPHRKQLVFSGDFIPNSAGLWAGAADGGLQELSPDGVVFSRMTSRGDGIVYMYRQSTTGQRFVYLDGANRLRTLMDVTGTSPYVPEGTPGFTVDGLHYDAGTNSLILTSGGFAFTACSGGSANFVTVRRVPLSADGTRVAGDEICHEFDVSAALNEIPAGIGPGPGGSVIVVVDTNTNLQEPRVRQYDPATSSSFAFASPGPYPGAAAVSAGCWSSARDAVVILDSGVDVLRSFALGQGGEGTEIVTTLPVSPAGSSGEKATLLEITDDGCDGAWRPYGSGLAGSGGITPGFTGGGCAEPGGLVQLTLDDVLGGTSGFAFAGLSPASQFFKGGTLLVFPFVLQVPLPNVGGAVGVPGAGGLTVPVLLPNDPGLAGVSVFLQGAFVDPGAPVGVSLTQGLEMRLG